MDPYAVPTVEPSIIFPVGTIIEDVKGKYKILEPVVKQGNAHKYKCQVLEQKIPMPQHVKLHVQDQKIMWIMVLPQNLDKIRVVNE